MRICFSVFVALVACSCIGFLAFASFDEPEAGGTVAPIGEAEESETLEVSESTSTLQDEQIEEIVVDYPAALGTPYDWPEWLGEETDNLEASERDPAESIQPYSDDESEFLESSTVTLYDIQFALNSILFIMVLWSACAVVFLICKMVFPLFRGGR